MSDNAATTTAERKRAFEIYDLVTEQALLVTPRNKHLRFRLPEGKKLVFKPGQFAQMFIPHAGKTRRTSYSIASPPTHTDFFELCVTLVDGGVSSTYLHNMKVGDQIQAMAPLGTFTLAKDERDSVFIATGSGIAPFRSMVHYLVETGSPRKLYLLNGNRYEDDIIYRQEWEGLSQRNPNFKYMFTLSRAQWPGAKGYVQDKIEEFVPEPKAKDFYICGLVKMINAVQEKLLSLGVPKEQIHYERYD